MRRRPRSRWWPSPSRRPRRSRFPRAPTPKGALALAVLALFAAGCQDAQQRKGEHAVESYLRARSAGGYALKRTHCTRVARMVAEQLATHVFVCTVPTSATVCDEFRVTLAAGVYGVVPERRGIDCILPLH